MGMKYEDYRREIYALDSMINSVTDVDRRIELINKNISLNQAYIRALKRPIPVKIVFCVILSFAFLLGLMIFLPQIIVRKNKIEACERRISFLKRLKIELLHSKNN